MTQKERIMRYLNDCGSITQLEALREFGCMRLASRISELRYQDGLPIVGEYEEAKNRYGETVRYMRYRMENKNAE